MDWQKNLLLAAMGAVVILLIMRWDDFQQAQIAAQPDPAPAASASANTDIPSANASVSDVPQDASKVETATAAPSAQTIQVQTDSLHVTIDTRGGDIVRVALPQHYAEIDTPDQPFVLVENNSVETYSLQSGLIGQNGTDSADGRPVFASEATQYTLQENADTLTVDLTHDQDSATITKRFTFYRGEYRVEMDYLVKNTGEQPWQASLYGQIKRDSHEP